MKPKANSLKRSTKLTAVREINKEKKKKRRLKLLESEMKKGTSLPTSQK